MDGAMGGAGTSKSGGRAGTSVILGGPLLLILVERGLKGRPIPGAVFACTFTLPFSSFTIPVIMSWMSGLAWKKLALLYRRRAILKGTCRGLPGSVKSVAEAVVVALGAISWGACRARPCSAPLASPEAGSAVRSSPPKYKLRSCSKSLD